MYAKSAVGRCGKLEHGAPGNPARVGERERHVVFGEQREHAVVEPSALAEFHGELNVAREEREIRRECGELRGPEVGAELDEDGTEFVT